MRAELREAAETRAEPAQLYIGTKYSGTDYPWTNTSSWEKHSLSRWESLACWSTQKFIYNWCSKPQRLTHLSVFFFGFKKQKKRQKKKKNLTSKNPQFYSFNFLENYLKNTEQKTTMILKIQSKLGKRALLYF